MRRSAAFALFTLSLLLLIDPGLSPGSFAKKKEARPYRIIPGPYDRKHIADGNTPLASRFSLLGLTVRVAPLDRDARASFVETVRPGTDDPFATSPGRPERSLTFRVLFDNASESDVVFQPGNVVLITDRKHQGFPIDITDLYLQAERAGVGDAQRAVNKVVELMFDSSTTIRSGRKMERLLVFRQLPEKWKELVLHFSYIQINAETHTLSFTYHKQIEKD